jgi:hypothetical protein
MVEKILNSLSSEVWQLAFIIVLLAICYFAEMFTRALPKPAVAVGALLLGSPVYSYLWIANGRTSSDGSWANVGIVLAVVFVGLPLFGLGIFMIVKALRQINAPTGTHHISGQGEGFRFTDQQR